MTLWALLIAASLSWSFSFRAVKRLSKLAEKLSYDFIGEDFQQEIAKELKLSEGEVEMFKKASQTSITSRYRSDG